MIKNNRNNEQIYGRNDMIMLDQNNKIYGSLGIADKYVMKTEEGTMLVLSNPKLGKFGDVLTEFNMYGRSEQNKTTGKNLANGQNVNIYINSSASICGVTGADTGMVIDTSKLTNVTISTRSIQDRYRFGCVNTIPTKEAPVTCYNGRIKDGTKDSYTIDTTDYNYLIVNATKLEDIQVEKGSEATYYEPFTGGIPSPNPDYPQEIKSVVNPTVKVTNKDGLKVLSVTLNNITLNAIPVSRGGNITIDGQQYIADYVDVEHRKVIRNILKWYLADIKSGFNNVVWHMNISELGIDGSKIGLSNMFKIQNGKYNTVTTSELHIDISGKFVALNMRGMTDEEFKKWLSEKNPEVYNVLTVAEEIPITLEEASSFKQLMTYYPVTIIENNYNTWMKATYKSTESV